MGTYSRWKHIRGIFYHFQPHIFSKFISHHDSFLLGCLFKTGCLLTVFATRLVLISS